MSGLKSNELARKYNAASKRASSVQQVATRKVRDDAFLSKMGEFSELLFSLLFTRGLSLLSHGHENVRLD